MSPKTPSLVELKKPLTQMLGAAKVAELEDPTVRVQQQVLGLDVPEIYHVKKS